MDVIRKIGRTFADEHVVGVDPPMRPELPGVWRRRMNPFAGRAVSDKALTAEQDMRAGMQRLQGLALAPGSVDGLEILLDPDARGKAPAEALFQVSPGFGLARSGEDVSVGALRKMSFAMLPVILRADHEDALEGEGAPDRASRSTHDPEEESVAVGMAARLRPQLPRRLGATLGEIAANPESKFIPHVGVIVAQPVSATILGRAMDECAPDPRDEPYADLRRIDGCRIALYLWPSEMAAIAGGPDYALPAAGPALRNRLAYSVFDNEKLLLADEMHPWEQWGVPLAIAAFDEAWKLDFIDRSAVARVGGTPHARTPMVPATGDARLWQARIDQFLGQLIDLPDFGEATLRDAFVRMPPVGLLPPQMFDSALRRQHFFPGSFGVSAVPVPHSNLDLAIREAAPMASFNRSVPDRVELLVPVPDRVYEPGLLEVAEEDPRFAQAVAAFREDRAQWLTRREVSRRRYDRLMESVSGIVLGWAATDLSLEENSPAPRVQVPVEVSRTRRFDEQAAMRLHQMMGAHATLPVAKSDTIWFWVRIHSASKLTGLSLRLGTATLANAGSFAAGVFWGAPDVLPIGFDPTGLQARRVGDLPEAGVWHRLEIPADRAWRVDGKGLDNFSVNAVEFGQRGGEVEWASFGKTDASGKNYTYIGDDAPAGATLSTNQTPPGVPSPWPWAPVAGREDIGVPDFGTISENGVRRVSGLDAFRAQWTQDFLAADLAQVDENGLDAFLAEIEGRLKATNDAIDLGFVRARSDIYRVRQIMLGADAASRLVTSPSLADLASRDEGARATSKGISEFLVESVKRTPDAAVAQFKPAAAAGAQPAAERTTRPRIAFEPRMMMLNINTSAIGPASATPAGAGRAAPASSVPSVRAPAAAATPLFVLPATVAGASRQPATMQATSLNVARLSLDMTRYRPRDIQAQIPVAGLVERTVSVAERLTPPPAVQALSYAIASKAAVIGTLSGLVRGDSSRPRGIALGDLPMPGFEHRTKQADQPLFVPTLDVLLADRAKAVSAQEYIDADDLPDAKGKHESDYFTAAVEAIDNSVAIMRLVEGRVALFEALTDSIRQLRAGIIERAEEAAAYLRQVDVEVEEARHDLATADRLRAEEKARIEATNARRAAVLASEVGAIAWRRVREAGNRSPAPVLEISSGLEVSPIVACRRDHEEVPDEIHDYVELMRDAPVKWFPAIAAAVERIDRLEAARAAIEMMRIRASLPLYYRPPPPAPPKYLRGVHQALSVQRRIVEERRDMVAQINLNALTRLSLAQTHVQIRETASLADLISGRHRQPVLTRMAGEMIEGVAQIGACLHASFAEVPPAIRLGWAEMLSEFDRPAPLRSLAGLPGWPEVPLDLRRALQGFVDWLFHQVDREEPRATDAVNELVRIAMLMAADSPVDRIIPARLIEPIPARVGQRFQLAVDISRIRKGMTTLIRDRNDNIVSRAVIDDVVDGHASAVIVQNLTAITTLSHELRFHLVSGVG
ncbi:MAG TPA: hypothetical protein VF574_04545 [Allosphingosinicella sp.]|jgi:hypothetical protein